MFSRWAASVHPFKHEGPGVCQVLFFRCPFDVEDLAFALLGVLDTICACLRKYSGHVLQGYEVHPWVLVREVARMILVVWFGFIHQVEVPHRWLPGSFGLSYADFASWCCSSSCIALRDLYIPFINLEVFSWVGWGCTHMFSSRLQTSFCKFQGRWACYHRPQRCPYVVSLFARGPFWLK